MASSEKKSWRANASKMTTSENNSSGANARTETHSVTTRVFVSRSNRDDNVTTMLVEVLWHVAQRTKTTGGRKHECAQGDKKRASSEYGATINHRVARATPDRRTYQKVCWNQKDEPAGPRVRKMKMRRRTSDDAGVWVPVCGGESDVVVNVDRFKLCNGASLWLFWVSLLARVAPKRVLDFLM
jgi:hypothetical protein